MPKPERFFRDLDKKLTSPYASLGIAIFLTAAITLVFRGAGMDPISLRTGAALITGSPLGATAAWLLLKQYWINYGGPEKGDKKKRTLH